jgi:glutamine synthetase
VTATTKKDKACVLKTSKEQNIKFVRMWFTDILGFLKSFAITIDELELALEDGMGFDGSSIEGFARIDESDMMALPDPSTFQIIPWGSKETRVARMFCDIYWPRRETLRGRSQIRIEEESEESKRLGLHFLCRARA